MSDRRFVVHLRRPDPDARRSMLDRLNRTYCGRAIIAPIECLTDGDHLDLNEKLCDNCERSKARRGE